MPIQEQDFLEVNYTGILSDTAQIFDTTIPTVARKAQLPESDKLTPVIIQVGKHHLLPALEKQLIGKEIGVTFSVHLEAKEAFGVRHAALTQLVPTKKFKEQNIVPVPHLQVNIDGRIGVIRSVSGGRTLVDLNHPLAGKAVDYELAILRSVTEPKEQAEALLKLLGVPFTSTVVKEGGVLVVTQKEAIPEQLQQPITKQIQNAISSLKEVTFALAS